jgi:hypothetical protein
MFSKTRYILVAITVLLLLVLCWWMKPACHEDNATSVAETQLMTPAPSGFTATTETQEDTLDSSKFSCTNAPFVIERIERNECVVRFTLPAYQVSEEADSAGGTWQRITAEDASAIAVGGAPALPAYSFAFAVPDGADISVQLEEPSTTILTSCTPRPGISPRLSNTPQETEIEPDARYYGVKGSPFPSEAVTLSEDFCIRQLHGRIVTFAPFRYIPERDAVEVTTSAHLNIRFEGDTAAQLDTNDSFAQLQESFFINGTSLLRAQSKSSSSIGALVIVLPNDWAQLECIEEFVTWKRKLGWEVHVLSVGTATLPNTAIALKEALVQEYSSSHFTHLLILGNYTQVEPYQHLNCDSHGRNATDLATAGRITKMYLRVGSDTPYAFLDGTSDILFADVFLSRLPVASANELSAALTRLTALERGDLADTAWQKRAIYISDAQASAAQPFAGQPDSELIEAMRESLYTLYPAANTTTLYATDTYAPTASVLISALQHGSVLSLYLGHGACQRYGTTNFSTTEARALRNATHLPWFVAPVCQTGNLDHGSSYDVYCSNSSLGSKCLTAQLFAPQEPQAGAAAVISASDVTFWDPPIVLMQSFAQQLASGQYRTSGELFNSPLAASLQYCISYYDTYNEYGYDSAYATFQAWENYLAGDCSAVPRLTPAGTGFIRCSASTNNTLAVAIWQADATPAAGAIVAVENAGKYYSAYTNDDGIAELSIAPSVLDDDAMIRVIHPSIALIETQLRMQEDTALPQLSSTATSWQRYAPGVIHNFDRQGILFLHDKRNRAYTIAPLGAILYPDEKYWLWRTAE